MDAGRELRESAAAAAAPTEADARVVGQPAREAAIGRSVGRSGDSLGSCVVRSCGVLLYERLVEGGQRVRRPPRRRAGCAVAWRLEQIWICILRER